jgi:hypothetical protein
VQYVTVAVQQWWQASSIEDQTTASVEASRIVEKRPATVDIRLQLFIFSLNKLPCTTYVRACYEMFWRSHPTRSNTKSSRCGSVRDMYPQPSREESWTYKKYAVVWKGTNDAVESLES